jgi:hypothetical protein
VVFTWYVKAKEMGLAVGDWARDGRAHVSSIATKTMVFEAYFVMLLYRQLSAKTEERPAGLPGMAGMMARSTA